MTRLAFETACRAGAVELVDAYRQAASLKLGQLYRARPAQIKAPSVFVDSVAESTDAFTNNEGQRTVRVSIRAVWGLYDAGDAVDQRDRFVDGLYGYVMDHPHALGPNSTCSWVGVRDDEAWGPDWIPADTATYFSTLITLEGFAST